MTPILGIMASQISGHLTSPAYDSIATVNVGSGGSSSISFSSIPSTYKHLELRWIGRTTVASSGLDGLYVVFNSDTGSNYSGHRLLGNGTSVTANAYTSRGDILITTGLIRGNETSGNFGSGIMSVLDYANTNKYKITKTLTGANGSSQSEEILMSGSWMSTSAITSMTITAEANHTFAQYTQFALYGIKG